MRENLKILSEMKAYYVTWRNEKQWNIEKYWKQSIKYQLLMAKMYGISICGKKNEIRQASSVKA